MDWIIWLFVVAFVLLFIYRRATAGRRASSQLNRQYAQEFLEQNSTRVGVIVTDSGLQLEVLQQGTGTVHPQEQDRVLVHYVGQLSNGKVFDSSIARNEPVAFPLNRVIKGWTEGLQLMVEGEKVRLFIPPDLGYGDQDMGVIPPGSLLIFDVELLKIEA